VRTQATAAALAWLIGAGVASAAEPLTIDAAELVMPKKTEYKDWLVKMATKYDRQAVKFTGQAMPGDELGSILLAVPAKDGNRRMEVLVYVRGAKGLVGRTLTVEGKGKVVTDHKVTHPVQIDNAELK
jgi:hypothetical protein